MQKKAVDFLENKDKEEISDSQNYIETFKKIFTKKACDIELITQQLKRTMSKYVGVFRTNDGLTQALKNIMNIEKEYYKAGIKDKSLHWNMFLQHYLELGNMILSARATIESALWREESRGSSLEK